MLTVILPIVGLLIHLKAKAGSSFLGKLGDTSLGIYSCHMFFVIALGKVLGLLVLPLAAATLIERLLAVDCVAKGQLAYGRSER